MLNIYIITVVGSFIKLASNKIKQQKTAPATQRTTL